MEVTTYVEHALSTELSGNLVDLCPVGALTSKPYAYEARSWELTKTESIDVLDALGSNIRIDTRGAQVMRVLPRMNDDVNEEWISDKTRHAIDGLRYQRLDRPYVRKAGKLVEATWDEAFRPSSERLGKLEGGKIAAIAGDQCDAESMVALKDLMANLGSPNVDCRQDGAKLDGPRGSYIFNAGIRGIDQADAILLVGTNPRLRSAGAERAHPQALPARRPVRHRQHRARRRSDLSGRAAGRGPGDAGASWSRASSASSRSSRPPRTR